MVVLDDEDRENEGDLIGAADMMTQESMAFMIRHTSGLVCVSLEDERADALHLPLMVDAKANGDYMKTAFTVSCDMTTSTTGISAGERAATINALANDATKPTDLVRPGHVFPLRYREGGVMKRAGHTEAAVDVARLAGLNPSGVICEVMKEDGTMARLDNLIPFARKHKMKIGTIRDLIAYRRRHDHMVERRAETLFHSRWGGEWKAISFYNKATQSEQLVLQKGHVDPDRPTLVRMHQIAPLSDMFGREGPRSGTLERCMEIIAQEGAGIIVALRYDAPDMLTRLLRAVDKSGAGMDELRDYGVGAQILAELGVHDMVLLTNSHHSLIALDGYDLSVVGQRPIEL